MYLFDLLLFDMKLFTIFWDWKILIESSLKFSLDKFIYFSFLIPKGVIIGFVAVLKEWTDSIYLFFFLLSNEDGLLRLLFVVVVVKGYFLFVGVNLELSFEVFLYY